MQEGKDSLPSKWVLLCIPNKEADDIHTKIHSKNMTEKVHHQL